MKVNRDEEFGYIKGQLESIERRIQELEEHNTELSDKVDKVGSELAMYRHFVVWIRTTLLGMAFLVTMKWGDLMNWWNGDNG